jgi:hypothetical protein
MKLVLADLILLFHFSIVLFVVLGLVLIWVGYFLKLRWVRNFYFRLVHLLTMGIVLLESCVGWVCPFTTWENKLRESAGQTAYSESFIAHWVHRLMFYEFSERTFTIIYVLFFLVVIASFIFVRPDIKGRDYCP